MSEYNGIVVTHFINPHLFWYIKSNVDDKKKLKIEKKLLKVVKAAVASGDGKHFHAGLGDIFGVFYENKWIRAEIDQVLLDGNFIVWAIDYGRPITVNQKSMVRIDEVNAEAAIPIYMGGSANCLPVDSAVTGTTSKRKQSLRWPPKAIDQFQKALDMAETVWFKPTTSPGRDHVFGELCIKEKDGCTLISVVDALVEANVAVRAQISDYSKLNTIQFKRFQMNVDYAKATHEDSLAQFRLPKLENVKTKRNTNLFFDRKLKFYSQPVFIHGKQIEALEKDKWISFFSQQMQYHLKNERWLTDLHAYAWPHLIGGKSLIVADSGDKTNVYLPTICTMVTQLQGSKPREDCEIEALIICAGNETAKSIAATSRKLLSIRNNNNEVLCAMPHMDINLLVECTILVATPHTLMALLRNGHRFDLKFQLLKHFVIDEFSNVTEKFGEDLEKIIRIQMNIGMKECQTIITTTDWSEKLTILTKRLYDPMVAITAEASMAALNFSNVKVEYKITAKPYSVIPTLTRKTSNGHTAVICQSTEQAELLSEVFFNRLIPYVLVLDGQSKEDSERIATWSEGQSPSTLIVTESALRHISVDNVVHIIHFSTPSRFEKFSRHHRISFGAYRQFIVNKTPRPTSIIVLTQEEFKADVDVHNPTANECTDNKILGNFENRGICYSWLIQGAHCDHTCASRHHLVASDFPNNRCLPNCKIFFQISSINSPVHYVINILNDGVKAAKSNSLQLIIGGYVPNGSKKQQCLSKRFVMREGLDCQYGATVILHLNDIFVVNDVFQLRKTNDCTLAINDMASMSLLKILREQDVVRENPDRYVNILDELKRLQNNNEQARKQRSQKEKILDEE